MNQEVDKLIKQIAHLRVEVEMLKEARKEFQNRYELTPEFKKYAEAGVRLSLKDAELLAFELEVKQKALEIHQATNESVHPAIGIRKVRKLDYDQSAALQFCFLNLYSAVKLDTRTFEKHAKAVEETAPLPFVTYSSEVQAILASDLSKCLEG